MGLFEDDETATHDLVVERIVFVSPESGWTVARVRLEDGDREATAVGRLLGVNAGERLRVTADWSVDRTYGRQLRIHAFQALAPESLEGLERFLGSGLLRGVGKVTAHRLVQHFGDDTLRVLDDEPERLVEVAGIGRKTAARIRDAWREQRRVRDAMIFLQSHQISPRFAARIVKRFGDATVHTVRENPYLLAEEISGLGFGAADGVARSLGWRTDAPERIGGGALYALRQAAGNGHLYLPWERLARRTAELLVVDLELVEAALPGLAARGALVVDDDGDGNRCAYLPELHAAESAIAFHLRRLMTSSAVAPPIDVERAVGWFEERSALRFAPGQRQAVGRALTARVLVLTGGPGTGKTTLMRAVVEILSRKRQRVLLAAPTGRAANRLSEATGVEVRTIHRLLEFDAHALRFRRTRLRPLEADLVIIDEASMLDAQLAHALLEAIADGTRLLVVGDADQLPSVGPGRVLSDLIESGRVPVVRLEEIFRQKEASAIVINAHRIHRGERPLADPSEAADFFLIRRRQPEEILATLSEVVSRRLPRSFALDPLRDVQVLSPMRRGPLGTESLNRSLRELLNPGPRTDDAVGRWRLGDRVMQTRNNYELEVFNGDIGFVVAQDRDRGRLTVSFDARPVIYEASDLDDLDLAYACTVHKSQGSEYPCVVMLLHGQHFVMLQRNLLYTAVTRAQRLMVLIGDPASLDIALANSRQSERYSALPERLRALEGS